VKQASNKIWQKAASPTCYPLWLQMDSSDHGPRQIHGSLDSRDPEPKWHLDQFFGFCTAHPCAQHTDTQTTLCATPVAICYACDRLKINTKQTDLTRKPFNSAISDIKFTMYCFFIIVTRDGFCQVIFHLNYKHSNGKYRFHACHILLLQYRWGVNLQEVKPTGR